MPKKNKIPSETQKTTRDTCLDILSFVEQQTDNGRQLVEVFTCLPSKELYPDYYDVIQNPVALDTIHDSIPNYDSLADFKHDFTTMIENAKIYNRKGSGIYKDATTLMAAFEEYCSSFDFDDSTSVTNALELQLSLILKKLLSYKKEGRVVSLFFQELPDANEYPDYYVEIKRPIALDIISRNIKNHQYKEYSDFEADFNLMISNAKQYNQKDSFVWLEAEYLKKYLDSIAFDILNSSPKLSLNQAIKSPTKGSPMKGSEITKEIEQPHGNIIESIPFKGDSLKIGDSVLIKNSVDPSKPIIAQINDFFTNSNGKYGLLVCWYLLPEQTIHKANTKFMEKEVMKTNHIERYEINDVIKKCWVLFVRDYMRGRPIGAIEADTFVCESRYNEQNKTITKIKNWQSCLPEIIRSKELELELFDAPIVPVRVASAFAEMLPIGKKENIDDDSADAMDRKILRKKIVDKVLDTPAPPISQISQPAAPVHSYMSNSHSYGMQNSRQNSTPRGPATQINPIYYNQLGHGPGENLNERTVSAFQTIEGKVKWFTAPPLDIVPNSILVHSVEYIRRKAQKAKETAAKREMEMDIDEPTKIPSPKKAKNLNFPTGNNCELEQENAIDWSPVKSTLETLARIWLADADKLSRTVYS